MTSELRGPGLELSRGSNSSVYHILVTATFVTGEFLMSKIGPHTLEWVDSVNCRDIFCIVSGGVDDIEMK